MGTLDDESRDTVRPNCHVFMSTNWTGSALQMRRGCADYGKELSMDSGVVEVRE